MKQEVNGIIQDIYNTGWQIEMLNIFILYTVSCKKLCNNRQH